jgi:hypothetical protein
MKKRCSKEERIKFCEGWKQSGLTQKEFCAQNNIHIKSLSRWLYQIKKENRPSMEKAIKFLPVGNIVPEENYLEIISRNGITCKVYLSKGNIINFLGRLLECK